MKFSDRPRAIGKRAAIQKPTLRNRIGLWAGRLAFPAALALASCGQAPEAPRDAEPDAQPRLVKRPDLNEHYKCIDKVLENDVMPPIGMKRPEKKRLGAEMDEAIGELFREHPAWTRRETYEAYLEFFDNAKLSTGIPMFPGVAAAFREADYYPDDNTKRTVARRVVRTLKPTRIGGTRTYHYSYPSTMELLYYMPQSAVALAGVVNERGNSMKAVDVEDISGMFIHLVQAQRAFARVRHLLPEKGLFSHKLCEAFGQTELMTREQLAKLDYFYAKLIWEWEENRNFIEKISKVGGEIPADEHVHRSARMEWLCRFTRGYIKQGKLSKMGITELPDGFVAGHCSKVVREDPMDNMYWYMDRFFAKQIMEGKIPPPEGMEVIYR